MKSYNGLVIYYSAVQHSVTHIFVNVLMIQHSAQHHLYAKYCSSHFQSVDIFILDAFVVLFSSMGEYNFNTAKFRPDLCNKLRFIE